MEAPLDLEALYRDSKVQESLAALDNELVGLAPVKTRVREIAALLLVEKLRRQVGMSADPPPLHMSFTGNPGTGKTTVALRMAAILHGLGYVRKGHLVSVTRDDLVGQYIGHTAPKTKEVLKRAMGGVLFIDEAYYLYRPENERDYGQEAIEILLQAMENHRDDLVVILAGYPDRMAQFFSSNPGLASRVAHNLEFPDYSDDELAAIAGRMLDRMQYRLSPGAAAALRDYIPLRRKQPNFANARSIRNALDRARLRQANRLFEQRGQALTPDDARHAGGRRHPRQPDLPPGRPHGGNAMTSRPPPVRLIKRVRAVAFDLDGTLLDTAPDLAGATNHMLTALHLPSLSGGSGPVDDRRRRGGARRAGAHPGAQPAAPRARAAHGHRALQGGLLERHLRPQPHLSGGEGSAQDPG